MKKAKDKIIALNRKWNITARMASKAYEKAYKLRVPYNLLVGIDNSLGNKRSDQEIKSILELFYESKMVKEWLWKIKDEDGDFLYSFLSKVEENSFNSFSPADCLLIYMFFPKRFNIKYKVFNAMLDKIKDEEFKERLFTLNGKYGIMNQSINEERFVFIERNASFYYDLLKGDKKHKKYFLELLKHVWAMYSLDFIGCKIIEELFWAESSLESKQLIKARLYKFFKERFLIEEVKKTGIFPHEDEIILKVLTLLFKNTKHAFNSRLFFFRETYFNNKDIEEFFNKKLDIDYIKYAEKNYKKIKNIFAYLEIPICDYTNLVKRFGNECILAYGGEHGRFKIKCNDAEYFYLCKYIEITHGNMSEEDFEKKYSYSSIMKALGEIGDTKVSKRRKRELREIFLKNEKYINYIK